MCEFADFLSASQAGLFSLVRARSRAIPLISRAKARESIGMASRRARTRSGLRVVEAIGLIPAPGQPGAGSMPIAAPPCYFLPARQPGRSVGRPRYIRPSIWVNLDKG